MAYRGECCVTGINVSELLTASHIVPWETDVANRTNPQNGLCLNALHDRAFDRGLITITEELKIRLSPKLKSATGFGLKPMLIDYEGEPIRLPDHFLPSQEFLEYHRRHIFQR
jgi:predicted restriction endonuclease